MQSVREVADTSRGPSEEPTDRIAAEADQESDSSEGAREFKMNDPQRRKDLSPATLAASFDEVANLPMPPTPPQAPRRVQDPTPTKYTFDLDTYIGGGAESRICRKSKRFAWMQSTDEAFGTAFGVFDRLIIISPIHAWDANVYLSPGGFVFVGHYSHRKYYQRSIACD
jgi:hypothetical protein